MGSPEITNPDKKLQLPRFECTKCGACCRDDQILITVTKNDLYRIAKTLELDSNAVLRALDFYILDEGTPIPVGLEIIPSIETEEGSAYVALKKMENGDCIFLKDDQCMIHPIRPMVCRSFPFVFSEDDGELSWGLSSKKGICPGLGIGPMVSEEELISLAKEILRDLHAYRKFADEWNGQPTSRTALGFVSKALVL